MSLRAGDSASPMPKASSERWMRSHGRRGGAMSSSRNAFFTPPRRWGGGASSKAVIAGFDRAIQYSETGVIDRIGRSVLGAPPACNRARRRRDPVAGHDSELVANTEPPSQP